MPALYEPLLNYLESLRNRRIMLDILKAILFGIVEGVTEWLPISSTGHLILLEEFVKLENVSENFSEMFDVVIRLFGAILAVVVLFIDRDIRLSGKGHRYQQSEPVAYVNMDIMTLWFKILVACVPAAVIGVLFDDVLNELFYHWYVVAAGPDCIRYRFYCGRKLEQGKDTEGNGTFRSDLQGSAYHRYFPGDCSGISGHVPLRCNHCGRPAYRYYQTRSGRVHLLWLFRLCSARPV